MRLQITGALEHIRHDFAFTCCGYESRSRRMAESMTVFAKRKIAIGYGFLEELAFQKNRSLFRHRGYEVVSIPEDDFLTWVRGVLADHKSSRPVRILLDISCFTRVRLAKFLQAFFELGAFELEVYYSLAEYSSATRSEPPNEHLCPVSDYFSGWSGETEKAVALISGLGYEQLRALGITEFIDPFESWFFYPKSPIPAYDVEVGRANNLLLRDVPRSNVVSYPVVDGPRQIQKLLTLCRSARRDYRCVIMPLGPKVFAFSSLLVGCVFRDVSIWRASAGKFSMPKDRRPSSYSARFRIDCVSGSDELDAA